MQLPARGRGVSCTRAKGHKARVKRAHSHPGNPRACARVSGRAQASRATELRGIPSAPRACVCRRRYGRVCAAVAEDTDRDVRAVMTENMGSGAWGWSGSAWCCQTGGARRLFELTGEKSRVTPYLLLFLKISTRTIYRNHGRCKTSISGVSTSQASVDYFIGKLK